MSDLPPLQQGVGAPSVKGKRNAWHETLRAPQFVFLQYDDGRDPRCYRRGQIPFL